MAGQPFVVGPVFITNSAANISTVNPSANTYRLVRQIRIVNTNTVALTVTLYKGLTGGSAAGTEILETYSIPAHDEKNIYYPAGEKYTTSDFLSGLASTTNKAVITVSGETYAS